MSHFLVRHPAWSAWQVLRAWPVESQQRARRNAMVAATACAQRRAEREDVEAYLHDLAHPGVEGLDDLTDLPAAARS